MAAPLEASSATTTAAPPPRRLAFLSELMAQGLDVDSALSFFERLTARAQETVAPSTFREISLGDRVHCGAPALGLGMLVTVRKYTWRPRGAEKFADKSERQTLHDHYRVSPSVVSSCEQNGGANGYELKGLSLGKDSSEEKARWVLEDPLELEEVRMELFEKMVGRKADGILKPPSAVRFKHPLPTDAWTTDIEEVRVPLRELRDLTHFKADRDRARMLDRLEEFW
jgi:hypothetical protein